MHEVAEVPFSGVSLGVDVWRPEGALSGTAVLYFHGGGLFYGDRGDLPQRYVDEFMSRGNVLACADYPLAPEVPLADIVDAACAAWTWFVGRARELGCNRFLLFGRSAGTLLAFCVAKTALAGGPVPSPHGIIDFYGLYDLSDAFLGEPAPRFLAMPAVSRADMLRSCSASPVLAGPKERRFSIYVYARQTGLWLDLLGVRPADVEEYSIADKDLACLPPLFIAASTADEEVPYRVSKQLSRRAQSAHLHTVYYLEHDFDRDASNDAGIAAYRACLDWIDRLA